MLAYIKGILEIKTKGYIVVEVGGLGYKIFMPESTIAKAGNIGDKVQIHTFMRVREDDVSLYGFLRLYDSANDHVELPRPFTVVLPEYRPLVS